MKFLISLLINGLIIYAAAAVFSGISTVGYGHAVVAALLLAVVNTLVRPLLTLLTFPITILTLGLFLFVINGAMILLVSAILDGFNVDGLLWAILLSVVISGANLLIGGGGKEGN
jgi:putative membrane protein